MKYKKVVILLSLFVLVSIIYFVFNEIESNDINMDYNNSESTGKIIERDNILAEEKNREDLRKIIVYYFHTSFRCYSCRKIEEYTHKAILNGFNDEVTKGVLIWKPVNIDEPENKHFIKDYSLYTKSIIIEDQRRRGEPKWKLLDKTWTLLKDEEEFIKYIQDEVKQIMEGT